MVLEKILESPLDSKEIQPAGGIPTDASVFSYKLQFIGEIEAPQALPSPGEKVLREAQRPKRMWNAGDRAKPTTEHRLVATFSFPKA